ncbi:MAG TPA: HAD hydrolase family protein [Pyrinomonadaceae bacterium]|nr:HAD hydrolase family protein [Pyrinomonadaceae bacterium]
MSETRNPKIEIDEVTRRARRIKLLLMDCDGVMTDGRIWFTPDGDEQKGFHARDGLGVKLLHAAGIDTGVISGRTSNMLARRARDLEMTFVRQGIHDKVAVLNEILKAASIIEDECAYVGDDIPDVGIMQRVGLACAVADAAEEAKQVAHYVTRAAGGFGAVREVADLILKATRENPR